MATKAANNLNYTHYSHILKPLKSPPSLLNSFGELCWFLFKKETYQRTKACVNHRDYMAYMNSPNPINKHKALRTPRSGNSKKPHSTRVYNLIDSSDAKLVRKSQFSGTSYKKIIVPSLAFGDDFLKMLLA